MREVSDGQIAKLQALYKKCFSVTLTVEEAKDAARRLLTLFCPDFDEIYPLRPEK